MSVNLVPLLLTGVRLHPPGRTDKNLCRCFGAPARRVFPDNLITLDPEVFVANVHSLLTVHTRAAQRRLSKRHPQSIKNVLSLVRHPWQGCLTKDCNVNLVPLLWRPAFDTIRPGGPTRTSADVSVPRLTGVSLITWSHFCWIAERAVLHFPPPPPRVSK